MKAIYTVLVIAIGLPIGVTLQIKNEERQRCYAQRDELTKTSWSLQHGCKIKRFKVEGRMV